MRGIKEISGLCFWMDNKKASLMQQVLYNDRPVDRSRQALIRDLEKEVRTTPPQRIPIPAKKQSANRPA